MSASTGAGCTELYQKLHRMARRESARLGPHGALSTTTLLHETYLAVSGRDALAFPTEAHFLAYAARAMRGLVIDRVRQRQARKRGGGLRHHLAGHRTRRAVPAARDAQ